MAEAALAAPSRPGGGDTLDDADDQARVRAARWAMLLPHRELAVGIVSRTTASLAEAEDCVHDAMLRLVRRDDLDPARVRSLLIRAALHIAIDHRRAAAREQSAVVRLGGGFESDVVSPEQVLSRRAEADRVLAAVDSLPRRERQVMLHRLAGLSVAETAARLGISAKSVEGAYTRARARVRFLLGAVLAWVMERLRRSASPRGEAVVNTVAALLLLGPGWVQGGDDRPPLSSVPSPSGAQAHAGTAPDARTPPGSQRTPGHDDQPTAGQPPPGGSRPEPPTQHGPRLHNPPPNATVGAPIDAPDGLASTGVYVTLQTPDPSTYPGAFYAYPRTLQDCVATHVADPTASC
jgi:RNA polymerase sigma-70 factor (ECF subfamily)